VFGFDFVWFGVGCKRREGDGRERVSLFVVLVVVMMMTMEVVVGLKWW